MTQRGTKHTKHSIKKIKQNISQKEITENEKLLKEEMSDDEEAREKSKEEVNDKVSKTLVEGEEFKKLQKQAQ